MPDTTSSSIKVVQLNVARRSVAQQDLYSTMIDNDISVALVQEPYTFHSTVPAPNTLKVISCSSESSPRACIVTSSKLSVQNQVQFNSQFVTVCSITLNHSVLNLVSIYIPPRVNTRNEIVSIDPFLSKLQEIFSQLKGFTIVGGDFNSHHSLWGSARSDQRGNSICDFLASSNTFLVNSGDDPTFFTTREGRIFKSFIDLTIVSQNLSPFVSSWIVSDCVSTSDHRPIIIELNLKPSHDSKTTRKYKTNNVDWTDFLDFIRHCYPDWYSLVGAVSSGDEVESACEKIIIDIKLACEISLPKIKSRPRIVPWWTPELSVLRARARRFKRRFCRARSILLKEQYLLTWKAAQTEYEKEIVKTKMKSWRDFVSEQSRGTIWNNVYRVCKNCPSKVPSSLKKPDGTFTKDHEETASFLLNHFVPDDIPCDDNIEQETIRSSIQNQLDLLSDDDVPFSYEEVANVISKFNDKKSPGEDAISANILKMVFQEAGLIIVMLFNLCLKFKTFPRCLKLSLVRAIPKLVVDGSSPKGWRPISLLPLLGKTLEKLLITRVMFNLRSRQLTSPKQFGFTPQKSTHDAINHVIEKMRFILEKKCHGALVSLDVSAAFDSAWWPAILNRLQQLKIPSNLWHLCHSYFSNRTVKLPIGNAVAVKEATRGCPQGSTCGPAFWNILYEEILNLALPINCELIAFADDLVLICYAKNPSDLEILTNNSIELIVQRGKTVKLEFNETKTKAMIFTRAKKKPELNLMMNNEKIEAVNELRYLGVVIDHKLTFKAHLNHVAIKIAKVVNIFSAIVRNTWGVSYDVTKLLYTAVFESTALYAVSSWGSCLSKKYAIDLLTKMQRQCLLRVCRSYPDTSTDALCIIADIMPLHVKAGMLYDLNRAHLEGSFILGAENVNIQTRVLCQRHPATSIQHFVSKSCQTPTSDITIFTDGSKIDDSVGASFVVYENDIETDHFMFRLPSYCSIFQAELYAIHKAIDSILGSECETFTIFSDSQSSIKSLQDRDSRNFLVNKIQDQLLALERNKKKIKIAWIKAHAGNMGNERADELAKEAATTEQIQVELIPAPSSKVKYTMKLRYENAWNRYWHFSRNGRWTYSIFPTINERRKSNFTVDHVNCQIFTHHGKHRSHLKRINKHPTGRCRFCDRDAETIIHLVVDCPRFAAEKRTCENILNTEITKNNFAQLFRGTDAPVLSFAQKIFEKYL